MLPTLPMYRITGLGQHRAGDDDRIAATLEDRRRRTDQIAVPKLAEPFGTRCIDDRAHAGVIQPAGTHRTWFGRGVQHELFGTLKLGGRPAGKRELRMGSHVGFGDNGVFRLGDDGIVLNEHRAKRLVAAVGRRPRQRQRAADMRLVVEVDKRRPEGCRIEIGRSKIGRISNTDHGHGETEGGEGNGRLATSDLCVTATHAEMR